jgi:hypothetical protein
MRPILDERRRRRLSLISTVPEQIERELVSQMLRAERGAPAWDEVVRVNFHCNQACSFCFVSTHLPPAPRAQVESAIRAAAARGARIVLSGGEPTLHPELPDFIRLARSLGPHPVQIQTNAVRLDEPGRAEGLRAAGLDEAVVSLHASSAALSDAITEAPGTFERTLGGVDRLRAVGVSVRFNFVVCRANLAEPPAFVRLVGGRWPKSAIHFAFVAASTDVVPRDGRLIPRYTEALPYLAEGVAEAHRLGVPLSGFELNSGVPLCLVPDALDADRLTEIPAGLDQGEFVRGPACQGCRRYSTCRGLRRGYAELYGTDELRTL